MDLTKPQLIDIKLHQDDRGYVYCAMDGMDKLGIKRTYVVENFVRGQIRAWHGHKNGGTFFHVIKGAVKAGALPFTAHDEFHNNLTLKHAMVAEKRKIKDACTLVTLTERSPKLFYIPPGHFNGAYSLTDESKILVYSTVLFDEVKADDVRLPATFLEDIWEVKHR